MRIWLSMVVAVALLAGSGCGRKGDLQDPADAAAEQSATTTAAPGGASPGAQEPPAVQPGDAAPDRPFILDPLI